MQTRIVLLTLSLLAFLGSCSSQQQQAPLFPEDVMDQAQKVYNERKSYLGGYDPLAQIESDSTLDLNTKNALTFLYAYMINTDVSDYSVEFHRKNIEQAFKAREEMPWGKSVPSDLFRHFVLPLRVNNEALDEARLQLYDELKGVVADKDMKGAVLALNHWCHQHATYAPSDGRTLSPLSTMRNGLGRCGEESTFAVAIFRTMGIPARQVYTPRWAHTDDNHAWVEVWVDGKWHYLGACEPAPDLDMAWFDAPVLRAMLLHARAFGDYRGHEERLSHDDNYTIVNVTNNYAETATATVKVVDKNNKPLQGVEVRFGLYNYAELYPIVTRTTNQDGMVHAEFGKGDLVVNAGISPQQCAIGKISLHDGDAQITLTLGDYNEWPAEEHLVLTPPIERKPVLHVDSIEMAQNDKALAYNDSVRNAFIATFPTEATAQQLANELNVKPAYIDIFKQAYINSRGNHQVIENFLKKQDAESLPHAINLLSSLSTKDMVDVSGEVLDDAMQRNLTEAEWQNKEIISPRVAYEKLWPVQAELNNHLLKLRKEAGHDNDEHWGRMSNREKADWLLEVIKGYKVYQRYNPINQPQSPLTTIALQGGDMRDLMILFVRLCRTAGVPAKLDGAVNLPVYFDTTSHRWEVVHIGEVPNEQAQDDCLLTLHYDNSSYLSSPKYYYNFTVGYINDKGLLTTYEFDDGTELPSFRNKELLYFNNFVTTGTRLADGTVLYSRRKAECGQSTLLSFDNDTTQISVIGSFNPEALYRDAADNKEKSIMSTTGRGYFTLVFVQPHHEPSDHILRDLNALKDNNGNSLVPIVVLMKDGSTLSDEMKSLLPIAHWGYDPNGSLMKMLLEGIEYKSGNISMPVVVIADTFGRVVYVSEGYTIGIGERVHATVNTLTSATRDDIQ